MFLFDDETIDNGVKTFDSLKKVNEYDQEYWSARDIMPLMEYKQWRQFSDAIERAKAACKVSGYAISDHFADVRKIVKAGVATKRIADVHLSRYACYLIAMNGDPRKEAIALAQTYFAVKTRQQELAEHYDELTEDQKRLVIRNEMKNHNKSLFAAAQDAGVKTSLDFAIFQDNGYRGLYGGLSTKDIHRRKNLKPNEHILDHMGSIELSDNLFRAAQTEDQLRKQNITDKVKANQLHNAMGKKVRKFIADIGGTMPEDLPTPDKSIKQIESEQRKKLKKGKKGP